MPYKRRPPVSEDEMRRQRYQGHNSICQTLREIWERSPDENVRLQCRVAVAMAKAMHNRIKAYGEELRRIKGEDAFRTFEKSL